MEAGMRDLTATTAAGLIVEAGRQERPDSNNSSRPHSRIRGLVGLCRKLLHNDQLSSTDSLIQAAIIGQVPQLA